jgi:hypothetical protein
MHMPGPALQAVAVSPQQLSASVGAHLQQLEVARAHWHVGHALADAPVEVKACSSSSSSGRTAAAAATRQPRRVTAKGE